MTGEADLVLSAAVDLRIFIADLIHSMLTVAIAADGCTLDIGRERLPMIGSCVVCLLRPVASAAEVRNTFPGNRGSRIVVWKYLVGSVAGDAGRSVFSADDRCMVHAVFIVVSVVALQALDRCQP